MRDGLTPSVVTDASRAAIEAAAEKHEAPFTRALDRQLRRLVRDVIETWRDSTRIVHASGSVRITADTAAFRRAAHAVRVGLASEEWVPPEYHVPVTSDLIDEAAWNEQLGETTEKYREATIRTTGDALAGDLAVQFDVSNRLLDGVIAHQSGTKIVTAPADVVESMMDSLQVSYDEGHSIPRAARGMREAGYALSKTYAERIARTEIVSASNAASLAMVRGGTDLKYKVWMATLDGRARPEHEAADGQVVPIDEPFDVGDEALDAPGDGSAANSINCRCTLGYQDTPASVEALATRASRVPHDTGGASMAATDTTETDTDATTGAAWAGVIAQEGVDTGDGRRIEPDALNWRELPLTLMGQKTTPEWGGHTDAAVCGRIDSISRAGENINAAGVFDSGDWGADIERMVRDQMLRGVSIDLAVNEAEVIPSDDVEDPMEAWFMGTLVILDGTILGATVVPFPAFENASIAIVAGGAMRTHNPRYETLDGKRTLVVSFFMPFAPEFAAPMAPPPAAEDDEDSGDAVEEALAAVDEALDKLRDAIEAA